MGSQPHDPEPAQPPDRPPADSKAAAEPAPRRRPSSAKRRRSRDVPTETPATKDRDDLAATYEQLQEISRRTFAAGHLAVAYHALAGALHAAQDLEDESRLEDIQYMAQEQMAAIDSGMPMSTFSTKAAAHRGAEPLWATVARHAEMSRHLLRTRHHAGPVQERR